MDNYDYLENATKNYIDACDITSMYDLSLISHFNDIILSEPEKYYDYKYRQKVSLKKKNH